MEDHKCYNGKIFADSSRTKMIPCPHCQEARRIEARDGIEDEKGHKESLAFRLGVDKRFVSDVYNDEHIVGSADIYYMDKHTLSDFNSYTESLLGKLSVGDLPKHSLIMYLGRHAKLREYAYLLLASAYKGVLDITNIVSVRDIRMNQYKEDFSEHYTSDLEVVIITSGDINAIDIVRGFMQERSFRNKPTIVLLSTRRELTFVMSYLCSLDNPRYDLGLYIGLKYRDDVDMKKEGELIAKKAYKVANEELGTSQVPDLKLFKRDEEETEKETLKKGVSTIPNKNFIRNENKEGQLDFDLGSLMKTDSGFSGRIE